MTKFEIAIAVVMPHLFVAFHYLPLPEADAALTALLGAPPTWLGVAASALNWFNVIIWTIASVLWTLLLTSRAKRLGWWEKDGI